MKIINLLVYPVELSTPNGKTITIQPKPKSWRSGNVVVQEESEFGSILTVKEIAPKLPAKEIDTIFIMTQKDVEYARSLEVQRNDIFYIINDARFNPDMNKWEEYRILSNLVK